jgi:hypothetical protein
MSLVPKLGLISCTHYTLPNAKKGRLNTKFSNNLKTWLYVNVMFNN